MIDLAHIRDTLARSAIPEAEVPPHVTEMKPDFHIEWEGPTSRDHDALVRVEASRMALLLGDPTYPRGCNYLRVPLSPRDRDGPGIDCHWDADRHVLICYMDLEDGPLPEELNALPTLYDSAPELPDEPTDAPVKPIAPKRRH